MYFNENGVLDNSRAFFHTPSNLARSLFFFLTCTGHFYCDNNYCVERSHYDSYLLMYVKQGEGTVHYNNNTLNLKTNDVLLINCHLPHIYKTEKWETLWIHFNGNVSDTYFQLLYNKFGCVTNLQNSTIIPDHIMMILDAFESSEPINEPLISCYIQRMLAELMLNTSTLTIENSDKSNAIFDSINFIQDNYKNKMSLNELAKHVCISPFYFSRVFKKETGYSPYEYITMVRINHSKNLLKTTKLLIKEIAFTVGFNSESNFVTSFKDHTGITPSKFRYTSI
jgi:AraC family transcriptional regulator